MCTYIYAWLSQRYHIRCKKSFDCLYQLPILYFRRGSVTDFEETREHLIIRHDAWPAENTRTYTCQCDTDSNIILGSYLRPIIAVVLNRGWHDVTLGWHGSNVRVTSEYCIFFYIIYIIILLMLGIRVNIGFSWTRLTWIQKGWEPLNYIVRRIIILIILYYYNIGPRIIYQTVRTHRRSK